MIDSVLEPLLRSPKLPEHVEELNRVLVIEQQRRKKFYEEITEERKWEFINGEVIMHSPATYRHNSALMRLATLLHIWCNARELGRVTVEKTLCQFPRNDYEPDIVFFGSAKAAVIQPETLLHPVPDMIVEILSDSTERTDRTIKFQDYEAHGVQEYWIVNPEAETIEQYVAANGAYPKEASALKDGNILSIAIAGFEIPVRAVFDDAVNRTAAQRLLS